MTADINPAGLHWQAFAFRHGVRSCRASIQRILRRLMSAFCRSGEPSGNSGRASVIRVSKLVSSNRVRRISSHIVSTRIGTSIRFGRANRGLLAEAPSDGGGGCIACDRNAVEECFSTCGHQPTNGANWPEARTGLVWGMEDACADRLVWAMRFGLVQR